MSSKRSWSQQEKICFLVQIVEHLTGGKNKGIPYKQVTLPGRTEKSMSHTWSHLRAESAAFLQGQTTDGEGAESTGTLAPRRSSRKRTHTSSYRDTISDDEEDKVPMKKARLSSDEKATDGSQDTGSDSDQTLADTASKNGLLSQGPKSSEDAIKAEFQDGEA
ncbi:hypothetical protein F5Y13DRAFT_193125 [Hypoxylon sp. FL1857]|nr:hypothetical protein F5Y13DRAFT_193125 [Hypoxylon sp. FL1857]